MIISTVISPRPAMPCSNPSISSASLGVSTEVRLVKDQAALIEIELLDDLELLLLAGGEPRVHDSFNFFMCTEVTGPHRATMTRQNSKPGDYVDLLALIDVLAIPNICGSDVMRTSNFSLKPMKVNIFEATDSELDGVPNVPILKSQRTPKDFRNANIKADRELRKDAQYVPAFTNVPILVEDLHVPLSAEEAALLEHAKLELYGDDDLAALRDILFTWWEERFLAASSGAPAIGDSSKARR